MNREAPLSGEEPHPLQSCLGLSPHSEQVDEASQEALVGGQQGKQMLL